MNKNKRGNTNSRRTGIDRRWIPSNDHHPERRRRKDRRTIRNRSFLEPLEPNGAPENRELFPEIDIRTDRPEAKNATLPLDEKNFSMPRKAFFKKINSDDG